MYIKRRLIDDKLNKFPFKYGIDILVLISRGNHSENVYVTDSNGAINVNAVKHENAPQAAASCHYESV